MFNLLKEFGKAFLLVIDQISVKYPIPDNLIENLKSSISAVKFYL